MSKRGSRYDLTRGDAYFSSRANFPARLPRRRTSDFGYEYAPTVARTLDTVYPWYPAARVLVSNVRGFVSSPQARAFTPKARMLALGRLFYSAPARVRKCVQRKERRAVLFALERAGFAGSAPKRHYRRTEDSNWRC